MKKIILLLLLPAIFSISCGKDAVCERTKTENCECKPGDECLEGTLISLEKTYKVTNIQNKEVTIYAHFIPDMYPDEFFKIEHKLPAKYRKKGSSHVRIKYGPLQAPAFITYILCCIEDVK